jgi:hypothetical protein
MPLDRAMAPKEESVAHLRISVAGMMVLLLGLGLILASLRSPSDGAAAAVLLVTQATLAFAVLAVVYRAGEGRAFWLGFALFGWGYMALTWESWLGQSADRPEMLTSIALDHLGAWFHRTPDPQTAMWPFTGPTSGDQKNRLILAKLDEPVSMSFANETPLDDVLKYVKQATTTATYSGIQIYVDPVALNEAGKTMKSPVKLDVEGVPLRVTLGLLLKQLDLEYVVQDGLLKIGNASTVSSATPFRRMGHCYWALLAAFCGGCAGRTLHNTRTRETVPPGR